jgi:hypothetical protein
MPDRGGPTRATGLVGHPIRRLLLGHALPSSGERREHLGRPAGLAVLSGEALGSVAYATEAMVRVLIPVAGVAAFSFVVPISSVIIALLATLVFSYRQTIKAYPRPAARMSSRGTTSRLRSHRSPQRGCCSITC